MSQNLPFLIFDLDGTLIDSKKDIVTAVNLTLNEFGLDEIAASEIERYIGTGVRPLIQEKLTNAGIRDATVGDAAYNRNYLEHIVDTTVLYPGMKEFLEQSSARKIILTNKINLFVEPILKALNIDHYFLAAYGRDSFPTFKPDAGPFFEISNMHEVSFQDMIMIGDTDIDIMASKAAGIRSIAVTYGFGDVKQMTALAPTVIVNQASELQSAIEKIYLPGTYHNFC